MLTADQATNIILALGQPLLTTEIVSLDMAFDRMLAEPIISKLDFPHWDNSAMDGYAVSWSDFQATSADCSTILKVVETIPAGVKPTRSIGRGEAARIFTGAMLPDGADTIVMQEHAVLDGDMVTIQPAPQSLGEFVRHQGDFARVGQVILPAGTRLLPPAIAVLAAAQYTKVPVYKKPRVAIFSTGDELVTPGQALRSGQIVDSNQYAVAAVVQQWGGEPICLGIVPDRPEALAATMQMAIEQADLVLSTGGVSVGDYDYVDRVLAELGGHVHITAVAVKPGKPLTVATFEHAGRQVIYFGLPGNPVSALVSCWRFGHLSFQRLAGVPNPQVVWQQAITTQELRSNGQRESYLWGQAALVAGRYQFTPVAGGHNSGNLINLALANGMALLPVGTQQILAGQEITVLLIN
jgi:molybdopterin molybdotransferase